MNLIVGFAACVFFNRNSRDSRSGPWLRHFSSKKKGFELSSRQNIVTEEVCQSVHACIIRELKQATFLTTRTSTEN